jgi:uncharacterized protein (TIGR00645 family)
LAVVSSPLGHYILDRLWHNASRGRNDRSTTIAQQGSNRMPPVERVMENTLFAMRWLLAPLYFGLGVLLMLFSVQFFKELWHLFQQVGSLAEVDLVLASLAMVDIALVASLIVMVMLSGYENFVSKLDVGDATKSLAWLGKLDAGSLKIKVAASIVAISSIHLLKAFMNVTVVSNDKLMWLVIMHLTFVVSALLLAVMDRIVVMQR